jgi:hypothetical protein
LRDLLTQVELEIKRRKIDPNTIGDHLGSLPELTNRRIIGGYASVDIIDREKQRIPIQALKESSTRFMNNSFFRILTIFHSDVPVGRILPKWTNPNTGETFVTHVDDKGWWVVGEVRNDIEIANKVWKEIRKGNLRSFSIAGSSRDKLQKVEGGVSYEQVNTLDTCEVAICEIPVNSMSHFDVLWDPESVNIFGR